MLQIIIVLKPCLVNIQTRGVSYMCHMETCRRSGYTFWPSNPRPGVFFEPDSKTGRQICTITPSQGAYSQYCLAPSGWLWLICLFSPRQAVACNNDWLSLWTTRHAVLVANRNKRLVASYPGTLEQDLHVENVRTFYWALFPFETRKQSQGWKMCQMSGLWLLIDVTYVSTLKYPFIGHK